MTLSTSDVMAALPIGVILPFLGDTASLPKGWALCDKNTPGTPDLSKSFLRGAANADEINETGGSENHRHVCDKNGVLAHNGWHKDGECEQGKTNAVSHLPPFYRVYFIMKIN